MEGRVLVFELLLDLVEVFVESVEEVGVTAPAVAAAVVVVVDATALTRNLYLALQILETGAPVNAAIAAYLEKKLKPVM